jgi:hypothetical protein
VVSFSLVQSATGEVADYAGIVAAARAVGALVVVDALAGLRLAAVRRRPGRRGHRVGLQVADVPAGSAFAYLGPVGAATAAADRRRLVRRSRRARSYYGLPMVLAEDARRFDVSPAWFSWVGTAPTLQLVEQIGDRRHPRPQVALANRFLAGLGQPPANSAIVTVDVPGPRSGWPGPVSGPRSGPARSGPRSTSTRRTRTSTSPSTR